MPTTSKEMFSFCLQINVDQYCPSKLPHMLQKIALILCLGLLTFSVSAQKDRQELLVASIVRECPSLLDSDAANCEKQQAALEQQFGEAQSFIQDFLKKATLSIKHTNPDASREEIVKDSLSREQRYKEYEDKLNTLNSTVPANAEERKQMNAEKTKLCILITIKAPSKSAPYFAQLLQLYSAPEKEQFENRINRSQESWFHYKIWMYDMLDARFGTKDFLSYKLSRATQFYNRFVEMSELPLRDIDGELAFAKEIEPLVEEASKDGLLEKSRKELYASWYSFRGSAAELVYDADPTKDQMLFVEALYKTGLEYDPESIYLNYSLGRLYYNTSLEIGYAGVTGTLDESFTQEDQVDEYMMKAMPYLQKGGERGQAVLEMMGHGKQ